MDQKNSKNCSNPNCKKQNPQDFCNFGPQKKGKFGLRAVCNHCRKEEYWFDIDKSRKANKINHKKMVCLDYMVYLKKIIIKCLINRMGVVKFVVDINLNFKNL